MKDFDLAKVYPTIGGIPQQGYLFSVDRNFKGG
jgi:hypothetical protein